MNELPHADLRFALRIWQFRQQTDGCLASVLVVASVFPVFRFLLSPDSAAAFVMGIFLIALGIACLRLLNSAAMVARIHQALPSRPAPQIIEAEILDVYEHPAGLGMPTGKCTTTYWLPHPAWHQACESDFRQPDHFASGLIRIANGNLRYLRKGGRG